MSVMQTIVTIDVPDCPTVLPNVMGMPSWVVGWGIAVGTIIVLALIIGVATVRILGAEERTKREQNRARALIDAARETKVCPTCATTLDPLADLKNKK